MKRAMLIGLMLVIPGAVEGGLILPTDEGESAFEWEAWFEFYVYLQKGSTGPDPGDGSGSHERGEFSHSIPLGGHPWVLRTDHGSYINYKVDDCGSGITTHDDLELNIHYNEAGDPTKVDIIQASGNYTASQTKQFICDFYVCGERVITDWSGMDNATGRKNHFGETIIVPEPASLSLLVLGGLGLLARRSGRKV